MLRLGSTVYVAMYMYAKCYILGMRILEKQNFWYGKRLVVIIISLSDFASFWDAHNCDLEECFIYSRHVDSC